MELDEMKAVWQDLSEKIDTQNKLSDKIITSMRQQQYNKQIYSILIPELIGTVVCYALSLVIILNFDQLDHWNLALGGIVICVILMSLPVLSIRSVLRLLRFDVQSYGFEEVVGKYKEAKRQFKNVQKIGFYMGFPILIFSLPVMHKIMNGENLFNESNVWLWYLPFGVLFLILFSRWVIKHYFRAANKAEDILNNK